MGDRLVECVPNFSEGQNREVIDRITREIETVDGVRLLDVDPGFEMNRTESKNSRVGPAETRSFTARHPHALDESRGGRFLRI